MHQRSVTNPNPRRDQDNQSNQAMNQPNHVNERSRRVGGPPATDRSSFRLQYFQRSARFRTGSSSSGRNWCDDDDGVTADEISA